LLIQIRYILHTVAIIARLINILAIVEKLLKFIGIIFDKTFTTPFSTIIVGSLNKFNRGIIELRLKISIREQKIVKHKIKNK